MKRLLFALAVVLAPTVACTGDDTSPTPVDAAGADGTTDTDAGTGVDAPGACVLPTTSIACTDDTPCQAACATSVCYNFMQVGMRCTMACTPTGNECPAGWQCNNMGRCRPPN